MVEHLEKLPKISNFSLGLGKIKEKCMGWWTPRGSWRWRRPWREGQSWGSGSWRWNHGHRWRFEGSFVPECLILGADVSEVEVEEGHQEEHQEEHLVHSHDQVPEDGNHRLLLNIWRIFCYVPECLILGADASDEVEEGHPEEQQPGAVRHLGQGIKVVSRVEEDGGGGGDVTLIRRGKFISDLESVLSWTNLFVVPRATGMIFKGSPSVFVHHLIFIFPLWDTRVFTI